MKRGFGGSDVSTKRIRTDALQSYSLTQVSVGVEVIEPDSPPPMIDNQQSDFQYESKYTLIALFKENINQ